jgi:hypothetical protein
MKGTSGYLSNLSRKASSSHKNAPAREANKITRCSFVILMAWPKPDRQPDFQILFAESFQTLTGA